MKIQMDQTTDTFIIVKSGQDATPLAGSNSLAFPGSGAGLSGCEIPPGEASEKGIGKSEEVGCAPGGEQISGVPGKRGGFAGVRCAPAAGIQSGLVPGGWGYVGEENFRLPS